MGGPPGGGGDVARTVSSALTLGPWFRFLIPIIGVIIIICLVRFGRQRLDLSDLPEALDLRASQRKMPSIVSVLPLTRRHRENFLGDLEQEYRRAFDLLGFRKATFWLFKQTLREIPYAFYLRLQALMFRLLRKLGS